MRAKTHPFDPTEHLGTPETQAEYISAALETGDPAFIADSSAWLHAPAACPNSHATPACVAKVCKALSADGNPAFATIMKVVQALDEAAWGFCDARGR
jgi:probable addiction module antidote protein